MTDQANEPKKSNSSSENGSDFNSTLVSREAFGEERTQDWLAKFVADSDYFALDTEFGFLVNEKRHQSYESLYNKNVEHLRDASLLQIGLTGFKISQSSENDSQKEFHYTSLSMYVMPTSEEFGKTKLCITPSCFQFLAEHGFDLNKAFTESIEYTKPVDVVESKDAQKVKNDKLEEPESKKIKDQHDLKRFFKLISDSKKPIIVHCGIYDFIYIINNFIEEIPEYYSDFKTLLNKYFPHVYDTKHLSYKMGVEFDNTGLESLFEHMQDKFRKKFSLIEMHKPLIKQKAVNTAHDAAYDAFMTAQVFACFKTCFDVDVETEENFLFSRMWPKEDAISLAEKTT